jgi:hypothetical protein
MEEPAFKLDPAAVATCSESDRSAAPLASKMRRLTL